MVGDEMLRPTEPFEIELPDGFLEPVVILPFRIEDGYGIYDNSVVDLVKELKEEGIAASFFDDAPKRRWRSLMGEAPIDLALWFTYPVISELFIEGIKAALQRIFETYHPSKVSAKIVKDHIDSKGNHVKDWFEYEGDGDTFIQSLSILYSTENNEEIKGDENE